MKVTWNNKQYNLKLPKLLYNDDKTKKSQLHLNIRAYLKEKFPLELIYEEVKLAGTKLKVDFYIPSKNLMVEAQGIQHYEYNEHFHKNKFGMINSNRRDITKRLWCEENNIELVEIKYDQWEDDLRRAIT